MRHSLFSQINFAWKYDPLIETAQNNYSDVTWASWRPSSPTIPLFNSFLRLTTKKISKARTTCRLWGNSLVTGIFPAQRTSNAENEFMSWRVHGVGWSQLVQSVHLRPVYWSELKRKDRPIKVSWIDLCSSHWFQGTNIGLQASVGSGDGLAPGRRWPRSLTHMYISIYALIC